jgi:hypothetical protein
MAVAPRAKSVCTEGRETPAGASLSGNVGILPPADNVACTCIGEEKVVSEQIEC